MQKFSAREKGELCEKKEKKMLRECNYLDDYTWIVEKFSSSGGDDRGRRSVRVYERTSGSGSHTQWPKEPKHLFDIPVCQGVTRHLRRFHTKRDPLWPSSRSIYELRTIRVQLRVKIVNNRRQMARKGNCFLLPPLFSPLPPSVFKSQTSLCFFPFFSRIATKGRTFSCYLHGR